MRACSRVRLSSLTTPPDLKQLEDEIAAVAAKKEEAVKGQDFENAAKLRDEEKSKREAMEARKKEWADQQTSRTVCHRGRYCRRYLRLDRCSGCSAD